MPHIPGKQYMTTYTIPHCQQTIKMDMCEAALNDRHAHVLTNGQHVQLPPELGAAWGLSGPFARTMHK
jgi:hypothetical protein